MPFPASSEVPYHPSSVAFPIAVSSLGVPRQTALLPYAFHLCYLQAGSYSTDHYNLHVPTFPLPLLQTG